MTILQLISDFLRGCLICRGAGGGGREERLKRMEIFRAGVCRQSNVSSPLKVLLQVHPEYIDRGYMCCARVPT